MLAWNLEHDDPGSIYSVLNIEASRRLGDRWTLEFELRGWTNVSDQDLQFSLKNDDHVQITLSRFF